MEIIATVSEMREVTITGRMGENFGTVAEID